MSTQSRTGFIVATTVGLGLAGASFFGAIVGGLFLGTLLDAVVNPEPTTGQRIGGRIGSFWDNLWTPGSSDVWYRRPYFGISIPTTWSSPSYFQPHRSTVRVHNDGVSHSTHHRLASTGGVMNSTTYRPASTSWFPSGGYNSSSYSAPISSAATVNIPSNATVTTTHRLA